MARSKRRTKKESGTEFSDIEEALRRHVRAKGADYLKDPNITSVGVGLKNGTGPLSLQFTVATKGDASVIEALGSEPIPETVEIEGRTVPTDVIERSYEASFEIVEPEAISDRKRRRDPILPGISVAHTKVTAGTIGLIVFDRATGAPCILSNWHVLHGNRGAVGDRIVQPGPADNNFPFGNDTGTLLRSHLGAAGDCALARISGRQFDRTVFELGVVPRRMARVAIGDKVVKSGRTTGVTFGVVRRVDVMARVNFDPPAGQVAIGCFEIGVDPQKPPANGEVSMGGDSGSAWLIANGSNATDIFAGLHFGGESGTSTDEHALACYAASVQQKLDFLLDPPAGPELRSDRPDGAALRNGYDPAFLGVHVPMPGLSLAFKRDAVNFGAEQTIPYTHFSVCLSARRRLARFVAWNIDGARQVLLPRRGFQLDQRIDAKFQHGDELYADNALDRGHIARRADVCWGTVDEAEQANRDSFCFTNIAPQHERFNQSSRKGLWGELENLVFEQADLQDIKVSVIGGPVFQDDDVEYRGARLPRSFWKLLAYRGTDDALRVAVFVLSQSDLLIDLETLDLDPFRIHQVKVTDLAARTLLDLSAFVDADVMEHPELATHEAEAVALRDPALRVVEIRSALDVRL